MAQQLRVAREWISGGRHGGLVERRGDDRIDAALQRELCRRHHRIDGGLAGPRIDSRRLDIRRRLRPARHAAHHRGRAGRSFRSADLDDLLPPLLLCDGPPQNGRVPDDQRPATIVQRRLAPSAGDRLWPDSGRVAHRDGQQGFVHRLDFISARKRPTGGSGTSCAIRLNSVIHAQAGIQELQRVRALTRFPPARE